MSQGSPPCTPGLRGVMLTSLPAWPSALAAGFTGLSPQMCRVVYSQLLRSERSPGGGVSDILPVEMLSYLTPPTTTYGGALLGISPRLGLEPDLA